MGKSSLKPHTLMICFSLLLLCSCATTPDPSALVPASELPADVTINKDAGRGNLLFVTLRLESGEKLPFFVDTGSPATVFDKSLEPKLGKCVGTGAFWNFGTKHEMDIYAAPTLYIENTQLMTGRNI
jgi:hypothetical protein